MSAWGIGLALGAAYLVNKKFHLDGRLQQAVAEFEGAADPATDGVTSAEIRASHRQPATRSEVYNQKLPKEERNILEAKAAAAAQEVKAFDGTSTTEIEGVYLQMATFGF